MARPAAFWPCLGLGLFVLCTVAFAQAASATGRIEGVALFEDGRPASGARVTLTPGEWNTSAAADGTFVLDVTPGLYTLRATAENSTGGANVEAKEGQTTSVSVTINRKQGAEAGGSLFAFAFLAATAIAVALGGFYVNRKMAERGLDIDKSVLGGEPVKKPFRRRRKKAPPST